MLISTIYFIHTLTRIFHCLWRWVKKLKGIILPSYLETCWLVVGQGDPSGSIKSGSCGNFSHTSCTSTSTPFPYNHFSQTKAVLCSDGGFENVPNKNISLWSVELSHAADLSSLTEVVRFCVLFFTTWSRSQDCECCSKSYCVSATTSWVGSCSSGEEHIPD